MKTRRIRSTFAALLLVLPLAGTLMQGTAAAASPSGSTCNGLSPNIAGSSGSDWIQGTPFDDVIWGGGGNDLIWGMGGNDTICGVGGNDTIYGDADGVQYVTDNPGNDYIDGGSASDLLSGGPGADTIIANDRKFDTVDGGSEIDACVVDVVLDIVTGCP